MPSDRIEEPMSSDRIEPPYGEIWEQLREGEIVPFLGAGASIGPRPKDASFDGNHPKFLPTGSELAAWLASFVSFPETPASDLAKVASFYQVQAKGDRLAQRLRKVFEANYEYNKIHELLADVPKPMLIITTNYDDLIERAFRARNKRYHLVTHPEADDLAGSVLWWEPGSPSPRAWTPADLPLSIDGQGDSIIYKMHGTVLRPPLQTEWQNFVVTEEDYVNFLSRMTQKGGAVPASFMFHLRNSALLFLGYSLNDWNLRVLLHKLRRPTAKFDDARDDKADAPVKRANQKATWAIQSNPSQLERRLWRARDVEIFDVDLGDFATRVREWMSP